MKKAKITALILAVVLVVSGAAIGIYAADYYHMDDTAIAAMASSNITVETTDGITVFSPAQARTGFIFYPGGKVEYTAYAPLMKALAENGILCVIPKMPLNLAVLDVDAAEGILEYYPEIDTWYIGGHSLGGSMAASYAADCDDFAGLILLASYSTADLTQGDLRVLSVYGDRDGVLNREKYEQYRENLPESTVELVLEGANHAGFGAYGPQEGDGEAAISRQEQQEKTVEAICGFLLAQLAPAD